MGRYTTFVIRIWSNKEGRMHGTIQRTGSQDRLAFASLESILAFVRSHLDMTEEIRNETESSFHNKKGVSNG